MALAFPTHVLSTQTTITKPSNIRVQQAESGAIRMIDLGSTTQHLIAPVIEYLTVSERDTLTAWLETNKSTEIDLTIAGIVYRGNVDPRVAVVQVPARSGGVSWTVTFGFIGVEQP